MTATPAIPPVIWLDLTQVRMGYTSDPETVEPGDVAFVPQARLQAAEDALRAEIETLRAEVEKERRYLTSVIARHNHLASENDALRADRDRLAADLEVTMEALALALDDLDEWVACKTSLEAAGFNMDDTAERADTVRAALARIAGGDNG